MAISIRLLLFLLLTGAAAAGAADAVPGRSWFSVGADGSARRLEERPNGEKTVELAPGERLFCFEEPDRKTFRPDAEKDRRSKRVLRLNVKSAEDSEAPIELKLFVQGKDGGFFQSRTGWVLRPGGSVTLEAPLAAAENFFEGVGTHANWSMLEAATIFQVGAASVHPAEKRILLTLGEVRYEEEREKVLLRLTDWWFPEGNQRRNAMIESRFELSREYFNPFDPDEIQMDFEVLSPDGKKSVFPAFYNRDYTRRLVNGTEKVFPVGRPYWAFRYTPVQVGKYAVRLIGRDDSGAELRSELRTFRVLESDLPGFVRAGRKPSKFFRFDNGTTFYPIGLNVHTVTDLRGEERFSLLPRPDGGTFDYDRYFELCAEAGINAVEIWMASWGVAIEWSSSLPDCYGLGRYSLAQAWRLDRILAQGAKNGIRFHLVLDNHGKMTSSVDQEWIHNPLNKKAEFAVADGGCLDSAGQFFIETDPEKSPAARYYSKRNRYIAARWGANPAIFGVELWSEIDLTGDFFNHYSNEAGNVMTKWLAFAVADFRKHDSGVHPITVHVCGTYENNLKYRALWQESPMDYVVGDQYFGGSPNQLMLDMIRRQVASDVFEQPWMITEFGSPGGRRGPEHVRGEIHSGLWGAFFLGQPGTPFCWWHEFVLSGEENLSHYRGFATLTKRFDRADPEWRRLKMKVENATFMVDSEALERPTTVLGWLFRRQAMFSYPIRPAESPLVEQTRLTLATRLPPGRCRIDFFDSVSAKLRRRLNAEVGADGTLCFDAPPFRIDTFFVIEPEAGK